MCLILHSSSLGSSEPQPTLPILALTARRGPGHPDLGPTRNIQPRGVHMWKLSACHSLCAQRRSGLSGPYLAGTLEKQTGIFSICIDPLPIFFFSIRTHFCKGLAMPLLRFIYLLPLSIPLLFTSQRGSASLTYKRNARSSSKTANTLWSLAGLAPSLHSCLAKFLFSLYILMASTSPTPGSLRTTWTKFSSAAVCPLFYTCLTECSLRF